MISSTANSKVKRLAALMQKAKMRREEQAFVVEGVKMFREAPAEWVREVYVSEGFLQKSERGKDAVLNNRLSQYHYEVLSEEVFQKVSDTQTPQGILCVLSVPHYDLADRIDRMAAAGRIPFLILLEDLQDPGNLGTILRAGEGAGIDGVIMTKRTVDILNPKVIRATMGAIYRVPFFFVDHMSETIDFLQRKGVTVYAAHLDDSVDYDEADYTKPTAFLIGNEGNGLRRETADQAEQYIKIPMAGQVESLNAAAAAAILMYEAARQRRRNAKH
ncbi:MAG: 23S rRNA (guanosine(2251)-2'-O)-methyltransferase RlmB [Lachnospiraceae bacterium]|nr:23S rRNA (guanosine(2251)-2'-O)-methyltransferase RlmB [Lachnospiraceae bacterium]